jgi:hypothetical protein
MLVFYGRCKNPATLQMFTITWLATFLDTCGETRKACFLVGLEYNRKKNIHGITDSPRGDRAD